MKRVVWFLLLVALAGGGYWYSQQPKAEAPKPAAAGRAAVPVVTRAVEVKPIPEEIATIGTVQPIATIAIKARVDTVVDTVHFAEGQEVKAGEPLFTLDDRSLQAQLRQAQANLERDTANLAKARQDVARYGELLKRDAVARQQYDAAVATSNALEGTVKADQAAIESAKVALSYTRITAPLDGRTGTVNAKGGTMVRAADASPLVTITQLRPINVAFNVAERHLPAVRQAMSEGRLGITAAIPGRREAKSQGALTFIDSQVDQLSGTILVRGEFPNADTLLWPGQFVDVVLRLRIDPQALTLPADAVQTGQDGRFVYVVKPDNTVEMRSVTIGRSFEGQAVIASGLQAGEKVVVDGQSRLFPGATIAERPAGGGQGGKSSDAKTAQAGGAS